MLWSSENEQHYGFRAKALWGALEPTQTKCSSPLSLHAKEKKKGNTYTRDREDFDLVTLQHKRWIRTYKKQVVGRKENNKNVRWDEEKQNKEKAVFTQQTTKHISRLSWSWRFTINKHNYNVLVKPQLTFGGDPFSSTGGGRELLLVLVAGGSTL